MLCPTSGVGQLATAALWPASAGVRRKQTPGPPASTSITGLRLHRPENIWGVQEADVVFFCETAIDLTRLSRRASAHARRQLRLRRVCCARRYLCPAAPSHVAGRDRR